MERSNINQTIVVLDWSNLMFRSLFMSNLFKGQDITYDNLDDVDSFIGKFCTDVLALIRTFMPSNVIIAVDAQNPWRKDVLPSDTSESEFGYKGTRSKSAKINWGNIFDASEEFLKILSQRGFHVAKVDRAEADDICAMVKECVIEEFPKSNVVIISADADIRQLINFNKDTHQYCVVYNTIPRGKGQKRNLYVTAEMAKFLNEPEVNDIFFSNIDPVKSYWKNIFSGAPYIEIVEEDPQSIVLGKIFCGDDGDNVPAIYEWYTATKKARVTKTKCEKILNEIDAHTIPMVLLKKQHLKEAMEKVLKREINDIDTDERLYRQRRLVELNSELFPANIRSYKSTLCFMIEDVKHYDYNSMKTNIFLDGTRFGNLMERKKRAIEKSVFKDMEKYHKNMGKLF